MFKNKLVIGYVYPEGITMITKEDALKHTHFNIAFGLVKEGKVTVDLANLEYFSKIRSYNPDIKIILSVGGWGNDGFSQAAATKEGRELFAESCVEVIREYGFDGIDLDWEYPCYGQAGIASSPDDKVNFTKLLETIRQALDKEEELTGHYYQLTIAVGADEYYIEGTEMDKVHEYLDYVQLMTYDLRCGFTIVTGHHANLFNSVGDLVRISSERTVDIFNKAGVPKEKLILGIAFYSRKWTGVPNRNNGLFQMSGSTGGYGPGFNELKESYINKNGYKRYFDKEAKAPYLFNGEEFISYEDEEAIHHKCEFVKTNGLGGVMYWEFSEDKSKTLVNAISKENLL